MLKERIMLKELIEEIGLEEVLRSQGIEPVDACVLLYQYGDFDLERLMRIDYEQDFVDEPDDEEDFDG